MTHRQRSASQGLQLDSLVCEKYMAKLMNRDKHINQLLSAAARSREKANASEYHMMKPRPNIRQQNMTSPQSKTLGRNTLQYSDDSALVEVTVKTTNNPSRQRSRSTTDKESWSQLLKQNRSGDKLSVFGNFDPLRTLHFLAKELQIQMHSVVPADSKIQQMITDMQYALKRVPPEVASQVHLQQGLEASAMKLNSNHAGHSKEEVETLDCGAQTDKTKSTEDSEKLQKLMAEGTLKLEASCRQMEKLCTDLKNEKNELEEELLQVKKQNITLKKKVDDLEIENNDILNPRIKALEDDKRKLEHQFKSLVNKFDSQSDQVINDLKSQVAELRSQKNSVEQQFTRLKHQIKVAALEREKFVAVLTLRDSQISEIRSEMSQLQELVNDQLMELHANAFQGAPAGENDNGAIVNHPNKHECHQNKANDNGDHTISTIPSNEDHTQSCELSFKDLQSGDIDVADLPELENIFNKFPNPKPKSLERIPSLDKLDSQASIKTMFDEIKKTAYAVAGDNKYT